MVSDAAPMLQLWSLLGVGVLLGACVLASRDRRAISWRLVGAGVLLQVVLGGAFLYWDTGNQWLQSLGRGVKGFLDLSARGTEFVFGDLGRQTSTRDLHLYEADDGVRFEARGLLASGASAPTFAVAADGVPRAVFEWGDPALPASLAGLAAAERAADGSWSEPVPLVIEGLPADVRTVFDPCLVRDGDALRLYFAAHRDRAGEAVLLSARWRPGGQCVLESGERLRVPGAVLAAPAVARLGDTWHLLAPVRGARDRAHHATSSDGLAFALRPPVELRGSGDWRGTLLADKQGLLFIGAGFSARSEDGVAWSAAPGPIVADANLTDPGVLALDDGTTWMALPGRPGFAFVFATQVVPTLIFFSSFMAVLYHLGIMQRLVSAMAVVMARLLGTSGAESLSACGNIFVGQTEAPLMVRPYLARMTMSELHAVMTGGYATIAGGVFALYVAFGIDPGHMMVASVMAVPAGLVVSKILWPETETSETMGRVVRGTGDRANNVVEAAASGALDGLRLALNVAAMLIAFLGLVSVLDWMLAGVGAWVGVEGLSVGVLLGWLFSPVAAVMGVAAGEIRLLAELLGTKIALTELVAFQQLGAMDAAGAVSERTMLIASFALCGFANLGSVAIQIGGLSAMAESRRADIAALAVRSMLAGAVATCVTACMAGVMRG